jgi:8-oxo-dGTP diphosphatase
VMREERDITLDPAALRPAGTMFRRSQQPRLDIFFTASTWLGQPEIHEPHKCTELVWADPEDLPEDALGFLGQACSDARTGQVFREYGRAEITGSLENGCCADGQLAAR